MSLKTSKILEEKETSRREGSAKARVDLCHPLWDVREKIDRVEKELLCTCAQLLLLSVSDVTEKTAKAARAGRAGGKVNDLALQVHTDFNEALGKTTIAVINALKATKDARIEITKAAAIVNGAIYDHVKIRDLKRTALEETVIVSEDWIVKNAECVKTRVTNAVEATVVAVETAVVRFKETAECARKANRASMVLDWIACLGKDVLLDYRILSDINTRAQVADALKYVVRMNYRVLSRVRAWWVVRRLVKQAGQNDKQQQKPMAVRWVVSHAEKLLCHSTTFMATKLGATTGPRASSGKQQATCRWRVMSHEQTQAPPSPQEGVGGLGGSAAPDQLGAREGSLFTAPSSSP